jgi:hypothetical protein
MYCAFSECLFYQKQLFMLLCLGGCFVFPLLVFHELLEPKKHLTLNMDSDDRAGFLVASGHRRRDYGVFHQKLLKLVLFQRNDPSRTVANFWFAFSPLRRKEANATPMLSVWPTLQLWFSRSFSQDVR